MPQAVEQPAEHVSSPLRVRWTREDCAAFVARGLLEDGRYELIEGEIIRKMGQRPPHASAVMRLIAWCLSVFGGDMVLSQATIDVAPEDNPTSEPEPDVFVLNRSATALGQNYPTPSDLVLVAEVADTTLAFDLSTKAGLYARAGIVEYWVIDVTGRALTVHRNPAEGVYGNVVRYAADEHVSTLARPDAAVVVSALLPSLAP